MLSLYITLPLLTALVLVQNAVLAPISVLGGRPDLVLIAVAVWAFLRGPAEGAVWAFIGGLLIFGGDAQPNVLSVPSESGRWL